MMSLFLATALQSISLATDFQDPAGRPPRREEEDLVLNVAAHVRYARISFNPGAFWTFDLELGVELGF